MIWQNAWAWIGLATLAVPIAVHLLARRRATRMAFPSLRFLEASSRLSVRRQRLTDLALLAVRLGVLLAAVAALAQPFVMTAGRRHDPAASLARAIVVDTSASMQRLTGAGVPAITEARAQARSAATGATTGRTVEAADLPTAIGGAVAWLAVQPGRHELVMISDFQAGAITTEDLATVPAGTGVRTIRVTPRVDFTATLPAAIGLTREAHATATAAASATETTWTSKPRSDVPDPSLQLLAGASEEPFARAARDAAFAGGLPMAAPERKSAIVFSGATERPALLSSVSLVDRPWMFDAVDALAQDATLASAARAVRMTTTAPPLPSDRCTIVARDAAGEPLVCAGASGDGAAHRLIVFSMADAGSLVSAALVAGLAHAVSAAPPLTELEPATIPPQETARWDRPPTDVAPPAGQPDVPSDGRWLWGAALALMLVESWLRRQRREIAAAPEVRRVA